MPIAYTYRGDTPGKQRARDVLYQLATVDVGPKRFSEEINVIVASRFCGDVKYLLARGSLPSNILACDTDELSRAAATSHGVSVSPHPDIIDTMRWAYEQYRDRIATLNFDLCHTILRVDLLEEALRYTPTKTTALYTFMRGRDGMNSLQERLGYLTRNIRANIRYLNYQSNTKDNAGSPMCIAAITAIGDSWFWDGKREPAKVKITDLANKKQLYLVSDPKSEPEITFTRLPPPGISVSHPPLPKIIPEIIIPLVKIVEEPKPVLLPQTDNDRKIEAILLEQIARKRKVLGTDSVCIGAIFTSRLFGLPTQEVFLAVQKSSKLRLFPSSASPNPIIVAADDPYCRYHQNHWRV
jgi:hypothetical protein